MKKAIVSYMPFFPSLREGIDRLKTDGERLEAYDMLTDYGLYGIEPDEESTPENLMLIFTLVRPIIDKSIRDYENGKKGGRPKKEDEKPGIKPGLKRGSKTDKDKEKELDKEMEKDSPYPNSFKEEEDRAPASADAAGAVLPFTLKDFMECAEEDGLDMTPEEIRKCYQANRRKGFEPPKGKRSFSILGTLRGWNKNKAPAPDPEPAPAPKPKPKPKSKDEQVMEISRAYIPEELLEKYPGAKRILTGAFCPKSAFIDQGRDDLVKYLQDSGIWLTNNPMGERSPIFQNLIARG